MLLIHNEKELKIIFSYILLLTLVLRPLYTIGYIAYFELNIDYIVATYCENKAKPQLQCNGKCHLADQLALSTTTNSSNDLAFNALHEAFLPVYFQAFQAFNFDVYDAISNTDNWNYTIVSFCFYTSVSSPPPQVA